MGAAMTKTLMLTTMEMMVVTTTHTTPARAGSGWLVVQLVDSIQNANMSTATVLKAVTSQSNQLKWVVGQVAQTLKMLHITKRKRLCSRNSG